MGNSEMQIMRWGIPGWITIFTYIVLVLSVNGYDIYQYTNDNELDGGYLAGLAALIVAGGVPLGYLIYQVYFSFKWSFMNKNKLRTNLSWSDVFNTEIDSEPDPKRDWLTAEKHFDALLTLFLSEEVNYQDIMRRYNSLKSRTDRVHGLGASLWGIAFSIMIFVSIHSFVYKIHPFNNLTFIITMLVLISIWYIIFRNYRDTNNDTFSQMSSIIFDIKFNLENRGN